MQPNLMDTNLMHDTADRLRILVANIPTAAEHSASGQYLKQTLVPITQSVAALMHQGSVEMVFRFASHGFRHPAFEAFRYLPELNPHAMIEAIAWGEEQGFDAAVVGCFGDPFLSEIRSACSIPVVGLGEAALRAAAAYGPFGVISPSGFLVEPTRHQIHAMGLGEQLVDVVVSGEPGNEQEHALIDAVSAIEHFCGASRGLIARGARALVPGCGLLSPALRMAPGARQRWPQGLREVDGVPVMEVFGCAVAAAMTAIRQCPKPSAQRRRWAEVSAAPAEMPKIHPGAFWNCPHQHVEPI